jgi:tRNA threonylcarbamoyladenosine biosynthesis protein TsaE
MFPLIIKDTGELSKVARKLLSIIENSKVIAFYGTMGAGKTTLIRTLCQAMGITDTVNSPTFALVNEYHKPSGEPVYHFDFYRIKKPEEAFDLGYEEYFFSRHLCLIEWPELISSLLPDDTLHLYIKVKDDGTRVISLNE